MKSAVLSLVIALALVPTTLMPTTLSAQTPAGAPSASDVRVRATPAGAQVAAAYLKLTAGAKGADRLIGAKVDPSIAGLVELHDMLNDGGIMRMRRIEGVEVKPGAPAELKPGGKHVMLMDLKRQLKAGDTIRIVLVFEKAGEVAVNAKVEQIGPASESGDHKGH